MEEIRGSSVSTRIIRKDLNVLGDREFGKNCMEFEVAGGKGKEFAAFCLRREAISCRTLDLRMGSEWFKQALGSH